MLRWGETGRVLGQRVMAPSTLGIAACEGLDADLELVEGLHHDKAFERYRAADIVVDQRTMRSGCVLRAGRRRCSDGLVHPVWSCASCGGAFLSCLRCAGGEAAGAG